MKEVGREAAISQFETYIKNKIRDDPKMYDLAELRGKRLGCWCVPERCHGEVLERLVRERFGTEAEKLGGTKGAGSAVLLGGKKFFDPESGAAAEKRKSSGTVASGGTTALSSKEGVSSKKQKLC